MPSPISRSHSLPAVAAPADEAAERTGSPSPSPQRARPGFDDPDVARLLPPSRRPRSSSPPRRRALRELLTSVESSGRAASDPLMEWAGIHARLEEPGIAGAQQLALLRQVTQTCPTELLQHDSPLDVGSEEERLQLAQSALAHPLVDRGSFDVAHLTYLFGLNSPASIARLLAPLIEKHGLDPAVCVAGLGLSERTDLELNGPAWDFRLDGKPAAMVVAEALLALHQPDPLRAVFTDMYDVVGAAAAALGSPLASEDERTGLARQMCCRSDSRTMAAIIARHFHAPEVRREFALAVASNCFSVEIGKLGELAQSLTDVVQKQVDCRLRTWAAQVGRHSTDELRMNLRIGMPIEKLAVQDQMDVYQHAVRAAGRFDRERGVPWSTLRQAIHDAYRSDRATFAAGSGDEAAARVADALGLKPPFIQMMANAATVDDEDRREALYEWILTAAFMVGRQQAATMERLGPMLASLYDARPAELRTELAGALTDAIHISGADKVADFVHSGLFHRRHMHAFATVLARLYTFNEAAVPAHLQKLLSHSKLKDGKRWQSVTRDLLTVVCGGGLPPPEQRRLIELSALPDRAGSGTVDDFVKRIKMLAVATQAIDQESVDGPASRSALNAATSAAELHAVLGRIARRATPGSASNRESGDPRLQVNWQRFMTESRQPEALLAFAQMVKRGSSLDQENDSGPDLDEEGRTKLVDVIDLYADAVVWSENKEQAFAALRYDTQASDHLAYIAARAPRAWKEWRTQAQAVQIVESQHGPVGPFDSRAYLRRRLVIDQHLPAAVFPTVRRVLEGQLEPSNARDQVQPDSSEHQLLRLLEHTENAQQHVRVVQALIAGMPADPQFGQFRRDLEDLKKLLTTRPASHSGMQAVDTDHHEDLLLCGTEVLGSCQSMSGQLRLNKGLMGYVVDGKYRMLAMHDNHGRLVARRVMRLLCDKQGAPALHVERLYANAGIEEGDAEDRALMQLAKNKAAGMGCPLFSDGDDNDVELVSLGSRAPFEYVDANGGLMEREYEIEAQRIA